MSTKSSPAFLALYYYKFGEKAYSEILFQRVEAFSDAVELLCEQAAALFGPIVRRLLVERSAISVQTAIDQTVVRDELYSWIVKESQKPWRGSGMFSIFSIFEPSRPPIPVEKLFNKSAAEKTEEIRSQAEVLDALLYTISTVDNTIHCDEGRCWADP